MSPIMYKNFPMEIKGSGYLINNISVVYNKTSKSFSLHLISKGIIKQ